MTFPRLSWSRLFSAAFSISPRIPNTKTVCGAATTLDRNGNARSRDEPAPPSASRNRSLIQRTKIQRTEPKRRIRFPTISKHGAGRLDYGYAVAIAKPTAIKGKSRRRSLPTRPQDGFAHAALPRYSITKNPLHRPCIHRRFIAEPFELFCTPRLPEHRAKSMVLAYKALRPD